MLLVALDLRIVIFTTNETLRIKDSVLGVRGVGILGSVTNKSLLIRKADP